MRVVVADKNCSGSVGIADIAGSCVPAAVVHTVTVASQTKLEAIGKGRKGASGGLLG